MSIIGSQSIISENITSVTEELQNTLVFKKCILQEFKVRVRSPLGVMANLERGTASRPRETEPQTCAAFPRGSSL